ncbi:MAG: flagellar hook capping protein [Gemmatimonadetes bacterium]|nr:flagellar hook capping protein [Gemmatimonadota bacterium]
MEVTPTNPNPSDPTSPQTAAQSSDFGKDEFLKLLVTQLSHQDPLSPMDNTAFVAQLAEFSALEQMTLVNENIEAQQSLIQGNTNSLTTSFIGKEVLAYGNAIDRDTSSETHDLTFELQSDADVTITITDSAGSTVRTIEESAMSTGRNTIEWDGKDGYGNDLAAGDYTFTVSATSDTGELVQTQTFTSGTVTGVRFGGGGSVLLLGERVVLLSDVLEINEQDSVNTDPPDEEI